MRLTDADQGAIERALFDFLQTLGQGRPHAGPALVVANATLEALMNQPHPGLAAVLGRLIHACANRIYANDCDERTRQGPSETILIGLALYNLWSPELETETEKPDLVDAYTAELIRAVPSARAKDADLCYLALLDPAVRAFEALPGPRRELLGALIERSPLAALAAPRHHLPAVLNDLAQNLLPGWQTKATTPASPWRDIDAWVHAVSQRLADPALARWLRNRWLRTPETRAACRNIGLMLEALRAKPDMRDFILEFYEAYDYFAAQHPSGQKAGKRCWPVLQKTEKLLRAEGDSEAAVRVNRRGNEYFLKFRPLIEIIRSEKRQPREFTQLTPYFILQGVNPLLRYATQSAGQALDLNNPQYESEEAAT